MSGAVAPEVELVEELEAVSRLIPSPCKDPQPRGQCSVEVPRGP